MDPALRVMNRAVRDGDCLVHPRGLMASGYTQVTITSPSGRQVLYGHRAMWEHIHGPIPEGQVIRHSCDNRACVRPEHLLVGTYGDNLQDAWDRTREPKIEVVCSKGHPRAWYGKWRKVRGRRSGGWWACRLCERENWRRHDAGRPNGWERQRGRS